MKILQFLEEVKLQVEVMLFMQIVHYTIVVFHAPFEILAVGAIQQVHVCLWKMMYRPSVFALLNGIQILNNAMIRV
jgi:hypothetical protein